MRNDDSYEAYKRKFNLGGCWCNYTYAGALVLGILMVRTTIGSYWLKI